MGLLVLILSGILGLGYLLQKSSGLVSRFLAWLLAVVAPVGITLQMREEKPGFLMIALILALLLGMKVVVAVWGKPAPSLNLSEWLGFSAGWIGMRPDVFKRMGGTAAPGFQRLLLKGAFFVMVGLLLFALARLAWIHAFLVYSNVFSLMLVLAFLLPALSLILHFGILTFLAGVWRWQGVPVGVLFNAPFKSKSLREFWGFRWNIAFAEMTAIAVYRPLRSKFGDATGRAGGYLFSGLAHELAISVPVNAGYGLPTAYFIIQAIGAWLERRFGVSGRLWTMFWVLLPVPILFHPPFIAEIVLPLVAGR